MTKKKSEGSDHLAIPLCYLVIYVTGDTNHLSCILYPPLNSFAFHDESFAFTSLLYSTYYVINCLKCQNSSLQCYITAFYVYFGLFNNEYTLLKLIFLLFKKYVI